MPYSRAQAELELQEVARMRAAAHSMLAAQEINSFEWLTLGSMLDGAERKINGRLIGIRLAIQDREAMEKSGKFAWVKSTANGLVIKIGQAQWRGTSSQEIERLEAQGYVVLQVKSGPFSKSAQPQNPVEAEVSTKRVLRRVTRAEAQQLSKTDAMIIWSEDKDWAEVVEYV